MKVNFSKPMSHSISFNQLAEWTHPDSSKDDENIVKFDYLEELNSPHLFVLMYPVKELTLDRLNKIIEDSNSITYIPWSL